MVGHAPARCKSRSHLFDSQPGHVKVGFKACAYIHDTPHTGEILMGWYECKSFIIKRKEKKIALSDMTDI